MTPDNPEDDDRTVIRPSTGAPPQPWLAAGVAGTDHRTDHRTDPRTDHPVNHAGGLPAGTRLGEFEITAFVAEGGFGLVYTAHDHSLQRRVALKEYMPSSLAARGAGTQVQVKSERHRDTFEAGLKSFINEARLLASFDHPSLVKVYRFWEANGTAYLVMPFLEGATLKDVLRQMGRPPDEAWLRSLLDPLTEALLVIHAQQCYHRDIAPDNVMLLTASDRHAGLRSGTGRWLLLDFGAARRVIGDMTQALTVILKPGYAPVEQYAEIPGLKQGAWTDVYALAAVVYFAIMGRTPPPSVGRLLHDTYVPLVQAAAGRYSERFLAAIDRALAVRPELRTQTIGELRQELGLSAAPGVHSAGGGAAGTLEQGPGGAGAAGAADTVPQRPPSPAAGRDGAGHKSSHGAALAVTGVLVLAALGFSAYRHLVPASPEHPAVATAAPVREPVPALATGAAAATDAAAQAASAPSATSPATPAATSPAGVSATTPGAFDPVAEFERIVQAQTPAFAVQASADKTQMRAGRDELKFQLSSEREGYVYVFGYSSDGALVLLVPNARSGTVRVKKGQTWRFPTGDGFYLPADEPVGTSSVLVMVSARQRNFDAMRPRAENLVRFFPTGESARALAAQHRGPGSVLAGTPLCAADAACGDEYGAALLRVETVK